MNDVRGELCAYRAEYAAHGLGACMRLIRSVFRSRAAIYSLDARTFGLLCFWWIQGNSWRDLSTWRRQAIDRAAWLGRIRPTD